MVGLRQNYIRIRNGLIRRVPLFIRKKFPKWYADKLYLIHFGRHINWKNPTEMNEKIRWMQFNTDTSKWSWLADKYKVREFIKEKGYQDILVPLYGVWERPEDIDFSNLPKKFVLKSNHGCGSVYLINDKNNINIEEIKNQLKKDLHQTYGIKTVELHYSNIKPLITAEALLEGKETFSSSLVDYKFYCVNGIPLYCGIMFNRNSIDHSYNVQLYDMNWENCSEFLNEQVKKTSVQIPKPKNFDRMIEFCIDVCKEFPFVRMDFYEVEGKLFFGEFTFTPAALKGGSLSKFVCEEIGSKIFLC